MTRRSSCSRARAPCTARSRLNASGCRKTTSAHPVLRMCPPDTVTANAPRNTFAPWLPRRPISRSRSRAASHSLVRSCPNINFAIGNFIRIRMDGDRIEVRGDGLRAVRTSTPQISQSGFGPSCFGGRGLPYNVGSEEDLSILDLAHLVARVISPHTPVHVGALLTDGAAATRYIPSTERATRDLGVERPRHATRWTSATWWTGTDLRTRARARVLPQPVFLSVVEP